MYVVKFSLRQLKCKSSNKVKILKTEITSRNLHFHIECDFTFFVVVCFWKLPDACLIILNSHGTTIWIKSSKLFW